MNLTKDAAVRKTYVERARTLQKKDSLARDFIKRDARRASTSAGRVVAELMRPEGPRIGGGTASRTNVGVNTALEVAGVVGKAGVAVSVGLAVYGVVEAPEGQKVEAAASAGGAMLTGAAVSSAGSFLGAAIGSIGGPLGAVIGGVIGGAAGGWLGGEMGASIVETAYKK